MNKKTLIMCLDELVKDLNKETESYIVGKGVRRFLAYKRDLSLSQFEVLCKDISKIKGVEIYEGCLVTRLGRIKLNEGSLEDYFHNKKISINRIAIGKDGFVFDDNQRDVIERDIRLNSFTIIEKSKDAYLEYMRLRYEGFHSNNGYCDATFFNTLDKKEIIKGVKMAIELPSLNIVYTLYNLNLYKSLSEEYVDERFLHDFLMSMLQNASENLLKINNDQLNKYKMVAFLSLIAKEKEYTHKELNNFFSSFGLNIDKEWYDDIIELYSLPRDKEEFREGCSSDTYHKKNIRECLILGYKES